MTGKHSLHDIEEAEKNRCGSGSAGWPWSGSVVLACCLSPPAWCVCSWTRQAWPRT